MNLLHSLVGSPTHVPSIPTTEEGKSIGCRCDLFIWHNKRYMLIDTSLTRCPAHRSQFFIRWRGRGDYGLSIILSDYRSSPPLHPKYEINKKNYYIIDDPF